MIPVDKNPLYALLDGTSLIEASAGTGKTYTITGLYVRLLLEEDLPVSRILVVTFTRAATEELKDRIRARISQTLKDFQANSSKDRFTRSLLQTCDHDRSIALLRRALAEFDLSSIHTIHGFCQRVLAENAFLCNAPFDAQVLPDQEETIMQIVRDFWRRRILALPETFLNHLLDDGLSPESLYDQIRAGLNHPLIRVLPKNQMEGTADMEREFSALFQRAREIWESASGEITAILLHSPDLKRNIFRIKTTQNRIDSLHSLFTTTPTVNKCLGLQCFTNSHIVYGTKKGCPVPEHPFFPIAEELFTLAARMKETYSRNKAVLQSKLLKTVRLELAREREKDNSMGYEDMLTRVYRALTLPHADRLIRAVQAMYSAALIDEFQDTDPLQFEIFRILFGSRPQILFLIGDPKQSIYSFRGADVFAYFAAARDCRTRLTLDTNYRSRPGLLKAVNALFSHRSNLPFGMKEITYTDVLPSPEMEEKSGAQPSLNFWYLEGDDKGKLNKPAARKLAAQAVAARIGKLIREQGTRAGDCAVLVRKNLEARLMRDELSRLAIPGVVYAAGSVFHTPEAEDLYLLFTAAADPSRVQKLRAAMLPPRLRDDAAPLDLFAPSQSFAEKVQERFREYHEIWSHSGSMFMMRRILLQEGIMPRLLSRSGGERSLTNLLHLMELVHHRETLDGTGMTGLCNWFQERMRTSASGEDEHQLRLESDENAVTILTIHKSKGLEFPVVFCPFLFDGTTLQGNSVFFHDPDCDNRLTIDFGSEEHERHKGFAGQEAFFENIRLLYVALTRAKEECHLFWGLVNGYETSALAYLLAPELTLERGVEEFKKQFQAVPESKIMDRLAELEDRSDGALTVKRGPLPIGRPVPFEAPPRSELKARCFQSTVDRSFMVTSFTSLTYNRNEPETFPFLDEQGAGVSLQEAQEEREEKDIFSFPKGARAGILLHSLLEEADFTRTDSRDLSPLVREKLAQNGFDPGWEDVLTGFVQDLVRTPLTPQGDLTLSSIPPSHRLNELEFYFPLERITPEKLGSLFSMPSQWREDLPERIGRLGFSPRRGFVRGFIDMVFSHEEKWYLLDWKSNHLGHALENYRRPEIEKVMLDDLYVLQYHLYSLALDRYLRKRITGYSYEAHFGGVFYLFLRGIDPEAGSGCGVFFDRPSQDMMQALDSVLISR